jgi:2-polyprenyl-6-hydroxyphenyl methylase / 3-demethylubiquinone-9 3-methyltransferase
MVKHLYYLWEAHMPVDNAIYTAPGDIWWDEKQPLSSLRTAINPGRIGYLGRILEETRFRTSGARALDIGCGGGLMAEEVARMGFVVTGIDPAEAAIDVAADHARRSGLNIAYQVGAGEALPFDDGQFDLVYCCDVLEHVVDVPSVIAESARVLRPGGVYFFDTINRTGASKLLMIKLFQEWHLTAWMPRDLHAWDRFVKPDELTHLLADSGLELGGMTGLAPSARPLQLLLDLVRLRRGTFTFGEFGRRSIFRETSDKSVLYAGYALKSAIR